MRFDKMMSLLLKNWEIMLKEKNNCRFTEQGACNTNHPYKVLQRFE